MIARPDDYAWSSWRGHVGQRIDPLLTPHPESLALGADPVTRASAYRALFAKALPDELVHEIRRYLNRRRHGD
jgi:putative transposase